MKKKKKFKLDLKAKIIIVILIVLVAIMSAFIAASLTKNIDVTDVAQSEISIKDIVESNDCEYITDTVSAEEGYDIDIYLKFGKDPVNSDGISAEPYYSTVFDSIAFKTGYLNVRLIDESREITVKIKCNEAKTAVVSILINDVTKDEYFSNLLSEYAKQKPLEITPINMTVSSTELNGLINNDWNPSNVNLGSKESTFKKYDIYFEEGIEIRNISKKVFNIVFNEKYKKDVISGIKVGTDLEAIKDRFGDAHYEKTGLVRI